MAPTRRTVLGQAGEAAAAAWLETRGYAILARNARTRFGEIDLVARDGGVVVFVEVKSRSGTAFGHPADAVTGRKQRRLARLAEAYLRREGLDGWPVRFDVVAVHLDPAGTARAIEHMPGAF
jgi:putative endonuclease